MFWVRTCLVWLMLSLPASAQQSGPPVLVIDSQRVFFETAYGRRLTDELATQAEALQTENDAIVASLIEEERSLTVRRPDMTVDAFRAEAAAFDIKVQEVTTPACEK